MKTWLFNPFERVAGWAALLAGLIVLFITALTAWYAGVRLDGVLDLHVTELVSLGTCLLEALINWLSMCLFICLTGLVFSKSSFRVVDVLGTQALARFPFLVSCLVTLCCFNNNMLNYIEYAFLGKGEAVTVTLLDFVLFGILLLVTICMTVWAVYLMFQAYRVACNVKGAKAVLSFIGALLFAELVSKMIIGILITN